MGKVTTSCLKYWRNNHETLQTYLTQTAELVKLLTGLGRSQAVVLIDTPKGNRPQDKRVD